MKENNHLPVFGVGPYLIFPIAIVTIIAVSFSFYGIIPYYSIKELNNIIMMLGAILIIFGAVFWLSAVVNSKVTENIKENKLVTTGIYAYVRHPIYSAFLYAITGLIFLSTNVLLFIFPVIYWLILTEAMKRTEERWLLVKFGDDYLDYEKKVNRFISR